MKTIVISITLLVGAAICFFSFGFHVPPTDEISIFRDVTDSIATQPDAREIVRLYHFHDGERWHGGIFRFSNVTDVSFNNWKEVRLPAANKWLSNEFERDKQIKDFQDGILSTLLGNSPASVGKAYSSIYFPLATELKRLSESMSQKKILIVYSDLMENDPDVSLYSQKDFHLLQSNPESLAQTFEGKMPLKNLNGIEVYFIFQPANAQQDVNFKIVSAFYKKLFEDKGAVVFVKANLN